MAEVTLKDIARIAGVSAATVDRVLHGRGNSRPETIERIQKVIADLGYRPNLAASQLVRGKGWRIGVLLPDTKIEFLEGLATSIPELELHFSKLGVSIQLARVDPSDPLTYAREFSEFAKELDACVVLGPNDPAMAKVVRLLEEDKIHIATLVSDLPNSIRTLFAGPDNGSMGATAGQLSLPLLERTEGAAVVVKPFAVQEDHEARFMGYFRALTGAGIDQSRIKSVAYRETRDAAVMTEVMSEGLANTGFSKIDAVYLTGGRTVPLVTAIESLDLDNPMIVGTDLTAASSRFLIERRIDAVVASDAVGELRDAIEGLQRKLTEPFWSPENITRPIQIYTRFNLPVQ